MVKKDIYQEITDQILSDLEKGLPVWEKPWKKGLWVFQQMPFPNLFIQGLIP